MTRAEFERRKGRLVRCGVCPMCGSPFDLEKVRSLVLRCSNPTCGAFYQRATARARRLGLVEGIGRCKPATAACRS